MPLALLRNNRIQPYGVTSIIPEKEEKLKLKPEGKISFIFPVMSNPKAYE
jgi:hypothetical protein